MVVDKPTLCSDLVEIIFACPRVSKLLECGKTSHKRLHWNYCKVLGFKLLWII